MGCGCAKRALALRKALENVAEGNGRAVLANVELVARSAVKDGRKALAKARLTSKRRR